MGATRVSFPVLAWTVHALILAALRPAAAAVTTLVPTDDTYVRGGTYANDNYDADPRLRVKNGSGTDNDRETLLRFELGGLQGGVLAARLELYCQDLSNGTPTSVFVHSVAVDTWKEDVVTWNTAPAAGGVLTAHTDITTVGQTYAFDVTGFVTQELSGDRIVSFLLRDDAEVRKVADFDRREDAHPPRLVVETRETFSLGVNTFGSGRVTLSPAGGNYVAGTVVTLTAIPDAGWRLEGWGGALSGATNPATVTMDANKSVWATFAQIPRHSLDLFVNGLGSVSLQPPGGTYTEGTSVLLVATPAVGSVFEGWSGDLGGAASSNTIVMNAPHTVTATFRSGPAAPSAVVLQQSVSGEASGVSLVSTAAAMSAVDGDLYLATVATKPFRSVTSITGLALPWSLVREQCSGRGETGVSLWMAQGTDVVAGAIDAVLAGRVDNVVMSVCRYTGVDRTQPLGSAVSGNSNGSNGTCAGGTNRTVYAVSIPDPGTVGVLFGAVAHRESAHTPGSGWIARDDLRHGASGAVASLAVVDRVLNAAAGGWVLDGAFDAAVDWAAVSVPLHPAYENPLSLSTAGLGSVTVLPSGGNYPAGTLVSLQAAPSAGWYFVGWGGDLSGATNPMSALMNGTVQAAATFSSTPQYDLGIEIQGAGSVEVTPAARRFAAGSMVTLVAKPRPGWIFSGWGGDASGGVPLLALSMQGNRSVTAQFRFAGTRVSGLWSSAAELATAPLQGAAWDQVWAAANLSFFPPNVADQNSGNNVDCLAAAIVFARTGDTAFRGRVTQALDYLAGIGNPGANTLAWARELGAYALAADLVGYRTSAFDAWLRAMAENYKGSDGRRLIEAFRERPNNWGMQAFGALVAVYAYLRDDAQLAAIRDDWVQSVIGTPPQAGFGELSWHFDPAHPRVINPPRAALHGLDIDGGIPDDLRRGGPLAVPPLRTDYPWGALQGIVMAARILDRYDPNLSIWSSGEEAPRRAARLMQEGWQQQFGGWAASGDDSWLLPFLDRAYGTHWSTGATAELRAGKNAGWAYVLLGSADLGTPSAAPSTSLLAYRLYPSFPNPFARTANIRFSVPIAGPVRVVVYDAMGRRVATLLDRTCPPGLHVLQWDGVDAVGARVARGVYWCQLQAGTHREAIRLTLLH